MKLKVDPPTQIRTGHTGHLITSDTSFQPVPISCCDFGRQLQMCSCQFAPYWRTLRQGLEVSHFTNCILSPFVRRQECSDGFWAHLTIHHPLCPRPPSISLSPQLIASHAPHGIWRLQKITRACFNSRPSKGTIREQPCDWRQSDSTGKMLTFLRKFSEVCRRVL